MPWRRYFHIYLFYMKALFQSRFLQRLGLCFLLCSAAFGASGASVSIEGSDHKVITESPEASTGLNNIFIVFNTAGCTLRYDGNGYTTAVYRYSNLGGAYAEEVRDIDREAAGLSFPLGKDDMGYIFEEGSSRIYCWVVNYANHPVTLSAVVPDDVPDCS